MDLEARLEKSISEGQAVLGTHTPTPPRSFLFETLNRERFNTWRVSSQKVLEAVDGPEGIYLKEFRAATDIGATQSQAQAGIGILERVLEDLRSGYFQKAAPTPDAMLLVTALCDRFHLVVGQLRQRHDNRATLDVSDEYDVQDLMHALLHLHFDDIRPEDWAPSYAGAASRVDFLLKNERTVIEVKKTRAGLTAKKLGEELIIDTARYKSQLDCDTLVCFVYDPEARIPNPRGLENDLSQDTPLKVRVFIRPR